MTLKDQIAADAAPVFFNTDEFAETIDWRPTATGGDLEGLACLADDAIDAETGEVVRSTSQIQVPVSEFSGREPKDRDRIDLRGRVCRIASLEKDPVAAVYDIWLDVGDPT